MDKTGNTMDRMKSGHPDELQKIQGIGPAIEKRLHAGGIITFAQLAAQSPHTLAKFFGDLPGFSPDAIESKGWIEQARKLAEENADAESPLEAPEEEAAQTQSRLHYAVFKVELLMDEENRVRRTSIVHIQTQAENSWAGWEKERLDEFIRAQSGVRAESQTSTTGLPSAELTQTRVKTEENEPVQILAAAQISPPGASRPEQGTGALEFVEARVLVKDFQEGTGMVRSEQPFRVRLRLDLHTPQSKRGSTARYETEIYAKQLGKGFRQLIARAAGRTELSDQIQLDIPTIGLAQGTYRLEALISIFPDGNGGKSSTAMRAMSESGLFYIQ